MKRKMLIGLAAAVLIAGCVGTAVKQAYYGVTGASGRYFEIRNMGGPTSLLAYRSAQVESFDPSPMLGAIPQDVVASVRPAVAAKLAELEAFKTGPVVRDTLYYRAGGGKPTLLIRGKFMDYDSGGSALRATGFGVDPFLTVQVEIVNAETKQVLGIAMVTGTVKSAVRVGPDELAEGVGKAVKGLLESHMKRPE